MDAVAENINLNEDAISGSKIAKTSNQNKIVTNIVSGEQTKDVKKDKVAKEKAKIKISAAQTHKIAPETKQEKLKRKAAYPPTSEMVMDSIKALKKRKGATFEDISKHMEEKYPVKMKVLKRHINKFLQTSVDNGVLEKTGGADTEEKFKIRKPESIKKTDPKNVRLLENKVKTAKKSIASKK